MKLSIFQPATGATRAEDCSPGSPIVLTYPPDQAAHRYEHKMIDPVPDGQMLVGTDAAQATFYPVPGRTLIRSRVAVDIDEDGIPDWLVTETVFDL